MLWVPRPPFHLCTCLDQVLTFPRLLSFGSPISNGRIEAQLTIHAGSLLPPCFWSQCPQQLQDRKPSLVLPGASLLYYLIWQEQTAQLPGPTSAHNLPSVCLHVLAEAPGSSRPIGGSWWTMCGQQARGQDTAFLSRALATSKAPVRSHTRTVPRIRPNSYLTDRFGKAIILLQKQMISPDPSSSCANWLITRPVICNQYYLLGIYFTGGKYL